MHNLGRLYKNFSDPPLDKMIILFGFKRKIKAIRQTDLPADQMEVLLRNCVRSEQGLSHRPFLYYL